MPYLDVLAASPFPVALDPEKTMKKIEKALIDSKALHFHLFRISSGVSSTADAYCLSAPNSCAGSCGHCEGRIQMSKKVSHLPHTLDATAL